MSFKDKIKTPFLTVDALITIQNNKGKLEGIVLIERKYPPLGYALPGGFVEIGETVEEAVIREAKEETNLDVLIDYMLGVYSDPNRDPRFHTVSVVFKCLARGTPQGKDDAKKAFVFPLDNLPLEKVVFDHSKIILDFLKREYFELYLFYKNKIYKDRL